MGSAPRTAGGPRLGPGGPVHTETFDYGCFLSDLTEFADIPSHGTQPSAPGSLD